MTKKKSPAPKTPTEVQPAEEKVEETFPEAVASILSVLVIGLFILTFLAQNYVIPSGSMEKTLLVGDHLVVDRITLAPPTKWMPLVRYRELESIIPQLLARAAGDQQPGIVEQSLGNADALPHSPRKTTQPLVADPVEVHQLQQIVDAPASRRGVEPLCCGQVFEKFLRCQLRIDAEILRQIAQHRAYTVGRADDVGAVPAHRAAGGAGDRSEDTHQGRLARPVRPEQPEHAGVNRQREIAETPEISRILFAQVVDDELHVVTPRAAPPSD